MAAVTAVAAVEATAAATVKYIPAAEMTQAGQRQRPPNL
tara:strand:+ start:335 stop:451 length:117 start_codon:yes stop_codon:yes gene_type:complete